MTDKLKALEGIVKSIIDKGYILIEEGEVIIESLCSLKEENKITEGQVIESIRQVQNSDSLYRRQCNKINVLSFMIAEMRKALEKSRDFHSSVYIPNESEVGTDYQRTMAKKGFEICSEILSTIAELESKMEVPNVHLCE